MQKTFITKIPRYECPLFGEVSPFNPCCTRIIALLRTGHAQERQCGHTDFAYSFHNHFSFYIYYSDCSSSDKPFFEATVFPHFLMCYEELTFTKNRFLNNHKLLFYQNPQAYSKYIFYYAFHLFYNEEYHAVNLNNK